MCHTRKSLEQLSEYKDAYKGETLFVLGNAPSVSGVYGLLKGKHVFACNFIFTWEGMSFTPPYYGVTEPTDHEGQWEYVDEISREVPHRFVLGRERPVPWRENWVYIPKIQPGKQNGQMDREGCRPDPPFSTAGTTPLNIGVQLGGYMGFKTIAVIGVELTPGHVYKHPTEGLAGKVVNKEMATRGWGGNRTRTVISAFDRAKEDLACRGTELVNCTPTGALEAHWGHIPVEEILEL